MARNIGARVSLGVALLAVHASVGLAAPASATYSYDDLGRLRTGEFTGGASNNRKIDYQYDPAGNRTTMTSGLVPTFEIGPASTVVEGASLTFPVTRRGVSASNITVDCVPQNKTARASTPAGVAPYDDYVTTPQTVMFTPADPDPTTKNCLIQTRVDDFYEGTQTLTAVLQNATAGAVIDQHFDQADGSITDVVQQQAPAFSFANGSALEGSAIAVSITRTGKSEPSQTVTFSTSDGSATQLDGDYTPIGSTQVLFANDQTGLQQHTFSITTTHDTKYEFSEVINVPWQVDGVAKPSGTATITNNDEGPRVRIDSPPLANEGSPITFTVTNEGNRLTAQSHSITWTLRNGTATAGSDYANIGGGTVSFGNNDATRLIQVPTLTDGVFDGGNETFFVDLSLNGSSNDATIAAGGGTGTGTIADADNPQPSVPGNIRQNPGGNTHIYDILWDASNGAVSYYVLEENQDNTIWSVVATTNAQTRLFHFNKTHSADYSYRVKACSAANVCSNYSQPETTRTVCVGMCD